MPAAAASARTSVSPTSAAVRLRASEGRRRVAGCSSRGLCCRSTMGAWNSPATGLARPRAPPARPPWPPRRCWERPCCSPPAPASAGSARWARWQAARRCPPWSRPDPPRRRPAPTTMPRRPSRRWPRPRQRPPGPPPAARPPGAAAARRGRRGAVHHAGGRQPATGRHDAGHGCADQRHALAQDAVVDPADGLDPHSHDQARPDGAGHAAAAPDPPAAPDSAAARAGATAPGSSAQTGQDAAGPRRPADRSRARATHGQRASLTPGTSQPSRSTSTETSSTGSGIGGSGLVALTLSDCAS